MSSQTFPSTGVGKPAFDPSKEYQTIGETPEQKKPKFNPKKGYDAVGDEDVIKETFKLDTSRLPQYSGTEDVFAEQAKSKKIISPKETELVKKAQQAQQYIAKELMDPNNKPSRQRLIQERKYKEYQSKIPLPISDQPKTGAELTAERLLPSLVNPKEKDFPVSEDEIQKEAINNMTDESSARRILKKIGKDNLIKQKQIERSIYELDAARNVIDDLNAAARSTKILKNSKDIENGKLTYDVESGILLKPEDTWASATTGWKMKNKAYADFDILLKYPKEKVIEEYEKRRREHDPDAPMPVPEGKLAEYGEMAGATPLKAIIGSAVTAAIPGAQEFAPVVGATLGGYDYGRIALAQNFDHIYNKLRDQGVAESEAYEKAIAAASRAALADAGTAAAMSFLGSRISGAIPRNSITQGVREAAISSLKNAGKSLSKDVVEGLLGGATGAFAQEYKNWLANEAGVYTPLDQGVYEQMEGNLFFTLGIAAATKAGKGLSGIKYKSLLNAVKKADDQRVNTTLQEMIQSGAISEAEAQTAKSEINSFKEIDSQIPSGVSDEARVKIQDKIKKRSELESQLEKTDKAFHPEIKEKIKAVEEDITKLAKEKTKVSPEQKKADKIVNTAIEEGRLSGTMADMAKSDPDGFLRMVADQAYGRTGTGEMSDLANAEYAVREQFGDEMVDVAKQIYPLEKPQSKMPPETIEGVDVSEHGEDIKTAAKQENGIKPSRLSEEGIIEAKELGDKIIEANQKKIITSKVQRATETAKVASQEVKTKIGIDIPVEEKEVLNTWDIGEYDGQPEGSFIEQEWVENPDVKPMGGESFNSFKERMEDAFLFVKNQPEDVHVITHSKVMRALQALEQTNGVWNEETTQHFLDLKEGEQSPVQKEINTLQGSYDRLLRAGESSDDPDMIRLQDKINNLKIQKDAETIRSDKGQVYEGGDERGRSTDQSRENIQFNEGEKPLITEVEQQAGRGEEGKGPGQEKIIAEGDNFVLRFKDLDDVANEFGFDPVEPRSPKSDIKLKEDAIKKIETWIKNGTYDKRIEALIRAGERGKGSTDEENMILSFHIASLRGKLRNMDIESPDYDATLKQLERAKEAGQIFRSTAGANLRVPTSRATPIEDIGEAMTAKMAAAGTDRLTLKQKEEVKAQVDKYKKASDTAAEKAQNLQDAVNNKKAQEDINKIKRQRKKKTSEEYKKDRALAIEAAREALKKLRTGQSGLSAVPLPGVRELVAIAPHVKKVMVSLVEEGIDKLEDVVIRLHEEFKDVLEGITEKNIRDIIAGEYAEKKPPLTDLQNQLKDLQMEARLINDIAALENGEPPKSENQKRILNQRLKDLKDQLKSIRKKLSQEQKEASSFYEEEFDDTAKSLMNIKNRNIARQEEILRKIQDKDFSGPEEKYSILEDPEVKKNYPTLRKEALDAIAAKEDAKQEFDIALYKDEFAKKSKWKKGIKYTGDVIHTSKAVLSGIDDSASFVQNWLFILTNPKSGGQAWLDHWKDAFSPKRFKRELAALHNSNDWDIIKESELDVLEPQSMAEGKAEEVFERNLLAKIKLTIGDKEIKPWEQTGGIFERAFTSLGNNLRVNLFRSRMRELLKEGKTFQSHKEEYKAAARAINEMTGRGKMAPEVEQISPYLTPVIWAPKMISSTLNLLGVSDIAATLVGRKGFYRQLTPGQRTFVAIEMARGVSLGVLIMSAASMGGAEVDYDPRSVTFGNIKSGNKSYNVFGRFASVVKTIVQFGLRERHKPGGKVEKYDTGEYGSKNSWELVGGFARGKMTPFAGVLYDLKAGKKYFTNEPFGLTDVPAELITPMSIKDLIQGMENDGAWGLLTRFLPAFEGIKVSDDRDFKKMQEQTKKRISKYKNKPTNN